MKKKQSLYLILWANVIFVPLLAYAEHTHLRYRRRINDNEFESNFINDAPETSSSSYRSFIINADDAYTPSSTPKESMTTYMSYNERQSPTAKYQQKTLAANYKNQSPSANLERKFAGKESRFEEQRYNSDDEKYGYILTARGKENIYEEDIANEYKPQEYQVSYPDKFESERVAEPKPTIGNEKRISNYEKSYNKYRYSYTNEGNSKEHRPKDQHYRDIPKARSFSSELQNHPQHQNQKFTENFGQKTSTWKQLGPNVEISSSGENPTYTRSTENKERPRKMYKKRKNTAAKSMRTGYMTPSQMPQHALYVSNNIQNMKPIKAIFDHSNVLKQSDKFDVNDAMTSEIEKEVAKKAAEYKIRIKQESPKDQPYNFETPEYQNFQFYNPPLPQQFYNVPALQQNKLPFSGSGIGFSKGFIRYIDVETNSSGAKKTIPALIIPLTPEQLGSPMFNPDAISSAYMNLINPVTPKPSPFPYDIVNTKFAQDSATGLPYDNYQFQNFYPQQFKNTQNLDENYPFGNLANQNLIPKYTYNLNNQPQTPITDTKQAPEGGYSNQRYENEEQRSNLPYSVIIPNKKTNAATHSAAGNDFKPSEYYEESNEESKYLSPSETNFFSTVTNPKENRNISQSFDKSETRRN